MGCVQTDAGADGCQLHELALIKEADAYIGLGGDLTKFDLGRIVDWLMLPTVKPSAACHSRSVPRTPKESGSLIVFMRRHPDCPEAT